MNKTLEYKNHSYIVKVVKEWRSNYRYSLGKKYLTIRVPKFMPDRLIYSHQEKAELWAIKQIEKRIQSGKPQTNKSYITGDLIKIYDQEFKIHIVESSNKNYSGKVVEDRLIIKVPQGESSNYEDIGKLISRVLARFFQPKFLNRVEYFNNLYIKEEINAVRLKLNKSNWGSCSSNNNLNFSTRLLFAPNEVIDYVIVHELAHLKEMNHSPKFWNIVQNIMPDYKQKEKWLKTNDHLCHF